MIKEYIAYIKDNPHKYWFKRRLYGFGWVPAMWQGWAVIVVYILLLLVLALTLDDGSSNREVMFMFVLPLVLLTGALIRICYAKGEKPRWQWGVPKDIEASKSDLNETERK